MRIKHLHVTTKKKHTIHTKKIIKIWRRNETAFGNHAAGGGRTPPPHHEGGVNIIKYNIKHNIKH
jgi:hypothetical protein